MDSRWATGGLPSQTSRWSGQTGCMQGVVNLLQKWHSRQSPWQPGGMKSHTHCFHQQGSKVERIINDFFFCFIRLVFSWMGCFPSSQHFVKKSLTVITMFFKVQALCHHASFCRLLGLCLTAETLLIVCMNMCFVVFSIWLKRLKECLSEVWEVTGAPLDSDLQQHLTQIIWSNAESPVSLLCTMKQNILCLF